ncbi:MAG: protein-glutamate O-methyltransferase CheR [Acetobacteraceae bacterium]|nr:protein-glutamate O-methyltransferase CheR [Acetobacteraceae bacterium]
MTITDLVRARSGIVLGADKAYLVESRLEQIVRNRRYRGLAELAARLRTDRNDELADEIVEAITTNETLFFRDGKPFEHLRLHLPILDNAHPPTRPLRIWSAAASSGQECYSIAITVLEAGLGARPVQILGTDISVEQINRARLGLYSDFEVQRGMPTQKLAKYFSRTDLGWQVVEPVRKLVEFRRWNLLDDTRPLGTFDLVFCRNVLIYFDIQTKRKVLDAIWTHLAPGGLLYLGGAETTFGVSDRFVPYSGAYQVYSAVPS